MLSYATFSQSDKDGFDELLIDYPTAVKITLSGNSYNFMKLRSYLGALNVMVKKTNSEEYICKQITLVNNLINSSRLSNTIVKNVTYKDEFKGWIVNKANDKNKNTINKEVPLFESYTFFYVTEFLYLLKKCGWINHSQENWKWWEGTVRFVEQNIWTKWRTRSYIASKTYNKTFLRSRTHMGSHWAGIAMYLNKLSHNKQIKEQTETLLNQYDTLLKRNLKSIGRAYVWNATYDDVSNTDASKAKENIIQDGSHGNHVVSYVIAAYELGNPNWTLQDIHRLAYTLVDLMYDEKTNSFRDNVDGSNDKNRPGWGNFVGDGWVKLAAYNEDAKKVLQNFNENTNKLKKYNQEVQFKSTLSPLLNDD